MPVQRLFYFLRRIFLCGLVLLLSGGAWAFPGLPEMIQRFKPSIVAVGTYDKTRSPAFALRGTGFVVGDGNLVATNAHVLPDALDVATRDTLVVRFNAGQDSVQQRAARLVAIDRDHDLALVRIEGPALPALSLRQEGMVREGQSVAFMGFPIGGALGMSTITHRGIISAVTPIALPGGNAQQLNEKLIKRLKSGTFDVYQLDGTAYPGNSGGPLFDGESGEVIGVINMVFVKGTKEAALSAPSGITFAVPVSFLLELLKEGR